MKDIIRIACYSAVLTGIAFSGIVGIAIGSGVLFAMLHLERSL